MGGRVGGTGGNGAPPAGSGGTSGNAGATGGAAGSPSASGGTFAPATGGNGGAGGFATGGNGGDPTPATGGNGGGSVVADASVANDAPMTTLDANADNRPDAGAQPDGGGAGCPAGMVRITSKSKTFTVGASASEAGTEWACFIGAHKVSFTYDYCMDANLVTQDDYNTLMGNNPSAHKGDLKFPVDSVTWFDAVVYSNKRSVRDGLQPAYSYDSVTTSGIHATALPGLALDIKKNGYRLPTNAEYEYAERADTTGVYFFAPTVTFAGYGSDTVASEYAWHRGNSGGVTHPVGTKKPNPWGLYDLIGNLFEWEHDWEYRYPTTDVVDPVGGPDGIKQCGTTFIANPARMAKGGSFKTDVKTHMRIIYHFKWPPGSITGEMGFRVVRTTE